MADKTAKFVTENFKGVLYVLFFVFSLYGQYTLNRYQVQDLEVKYKILDSRLDRQYQKLDAIKLDKSVFEVTMKQISSMSEDLHEIRENFIEAIQQKNLK